MGMGRWGDGEMGRWGDGEMGRRGDAGTRGRGDAKREVSSVNVHKKVSPLAAFT